MDTSQLAVIFVNGVLENAEKLRALVESAGLLVAADGGLKHALQMGIMPQVLIGDLDSVSQAEVKKVEAAGGQIFQFPEDKNETDLELALDLVLSRAYRQIVLIGASGGRTDQFLGNIYLLTDERFRQLDLRLIDDKEEIFVIRDKVEIEGNPGETVSLIPLSAEVNGVTTKGLQYPLEGERLLRHKTRGISNVILADRCTVAIQDGLLLCVHRFLAEEKFKE